MVRIGRGEEGGGREEKGEGKGRRRDEGKKGETHQ